MSCPLCLISIMSVKYPTCFSYSKGTFRRTRIETQVPVRKKKCRTVKAEMSWRLVWSEPLYQNAYSP